MHISENPWQASLTTRDRQGLESCHALGALDYTLEARSGTNCYRVLNLPYRVLCKA
jgi:hypothetical protein